MQRKANGLVYNASPQAGVRVIELSYEDSAAKRGRWLGELSAALDEAGRLTRELAAECSLEAAELHSRIVAARAEVQAIRLMRSLGDRDRIDPEWTKDMPWKRSA
jgi:hypothetical protein